MNESNNHLFKRQRLRKLVVVPKEKEEQIKLVTWMTKKNLIFFAVPNQRRCGQGEMMSLKRQGLAAGCPDLIIPMARGRYHALAIELKRQVGGIMKENQRYWLETLNHQGWLAVMCKGADEAIALLEKYLSLKDGESLC